VGGAGAAAPRLVTLALPKGSLQEATLALEVIIDESEAKRLIPPLRRNGARGTTEYPLNKVID